VRGPWCIGVGRTWWGMGGGGGGGGEPVLWDFKRLDEVDNVCSR